MRRVYDCFVMSDELDFLEIRLNTLTPVVDFFVIAECTHDYLGYRKPLYFYNNQARFKEFEDKIRHVICGNPPFSRPYVFEREHPNFWANEIYQKNKLALAIGDARSQDIIMISDVDEIPHPSTITKLTGDLDPIRLLGRMYYYNFNRFHLGNENAGDNWVAMTAACSYNHLPRSMNDLRMHRSCPTALEHGWHFTWFGGHAAITKKEIWYAHALSSTFAQRRAEGNPYSRTPCDGWGLSFTENVSDLPMYVQKNKIRFASHFDLIYIDNHPEEFNYNRL